MVKKISLLILSIITFINNNTCLNFNNKKIIAYVMTAPRVSLVVPQESMRWLSEELAHNHRVFSQATVQGNLGDLEAVIMTDADNHAQTSYHFVSLNDAAQDTAPQEVRYLMTITALKKLMTNDKHSFNKETARPATPVDLAPSPDHVHLAPQQTLANAVSTQKKNKFKLFLENHCKHYLRNNIKSVLAMKNRQHDTKA